MYESVYQVYAKYSTNTKIKQITPLLITNAPTKISPTEPRKTIVATTRTGLNMSLSCLKKPMRKPVPMREMRVPNA